MKCSKCDGNVISYEYAVYYSDGSRKGKYKCQDCGAEKEWVIQGSGEKTIDMS